MLHAFENNTIGSDTAFFIDIKKNIGIRFLYDVLVSSLQ